jgi:hypothetical protein
MGPKNHHHNSDRKDKVVSINGIRNKEAEKERAIKRMIALMGSKEAVDKCVEEFNKLSSEEILLSKAKKYQAGSLLPSEAFLKGIIEQYKLSQWMTRTIFRIGGRRYTRIKDGRTWSRQDIITEKSLEELEIFSAYRPDGANLPVCNKTLFNTYRQLNWCPVGRNLDPLIGNFNTFCKKIKEISKRGMEQHLQQQKSDSHSISSDALDANSITTQTVTMSRANTTGKKRSNTAIAADQGNILVVSRRPRNESDGAPYEWYGYKWAGESCAPDCTFTVLLNLYRCLPPDEQKRFMDGIQIAALQEELRCLTSRSPQELASVMQHLSRKEAFFSKIFPGRSFDQPVHNKGVFAYGEKIDVTRN